MAGLIWGRPRHGKAAGPAGVPCRQATAGAGHVVFRPQSPHIRHARDFAAALLAAPSGDLKSTPKSERAPANGSPKQPTLSALPNEGANMATGTVKFFNVTRGFGFIAPDDGGKDVFVHVTAVERAGLPPLVEGQKIRFEVTTERGKTAATDLQRA
jgi:CspA family cold shock protein